MHFFNTNVNHSGSAVDCSTQTYVNTYIPQSVTTTTRAGDAGRQICFKATDEAGNIVYKNSQQAIDGVANLGISSNSPGVSISSKRYTNSNSITFDGQTAPNTEVKLYIAQGGNTAWTTANILQTLDISSGSDGRFTSSPVSLGAGDYDIAGSIKTSPNSPYTTPIKIFDLEVDNTAPSLTIEDEAQIVSGFTNLVALTISVQVAENSKLDIVEGSSCATNADSSSFSTGSRNIPLTQADGSPFADGVTYRNCVIRATDYAGNTATLTVRAFTVDTTSPVQTVLPFVQAGATRDLSFTVTDANGLQIDGRAVSNTFTEEVSVASGAIASIVDSGLSVGDIAGNDIGLSIRVDNEAPTVSIREQFNVSNRRRPYLEVSVDRNQASIFATEGEVLTPVFTGSCSGFSVTEGQYVSTSNDSADYTITISSPRSKTYADCTLMFVDEAENTSAPVAVESFRISSGGSSGIVGAIRSYIAPEVVEEHGAAETEVRQEGAADELAPEAPEVTLSNTPSSEIRRSVASFKRPLDLGDKGEDVRSLQIFLNAQGFTVSNTGAGSAGQETTYFGPATKAALKKYQEAHSKDILEPLGLEAGTGYLGKSTIEKIEEDASKTKTPIQASSSKQAQIQTLRALINQLLQKVNLLRSRQSNRVQAPIVNRDQDSVDTAEPNFFPERTIFHFNSADL